MKACSGRNVGRAPGKRWPVIGYGWVLVYASELGQTCFRRPEKRDSSRQHGFYPNAKERFPRISWDLCSAWEVSKRRYFSTFHFNKEHLRRQHLGSMCSLQSCYRQKEFFLFMVNPQLLSQHGFIATKSSVLMVRGSSWVVTNPPLSCCTWAGLVRCCRHIPQRISYPCSDYHRGVVVPWVLSHGAMFV